MESADTRTVRTALADGDLGRLDDFIAAGPRGRLRERCAYLEAVSLYVDRCEVELALPDEALAAAREWIVEQAEQLLTQERSATSVSRVEALIDRARRSGPARTTR